MCCDAKQIYATPLVSKNNYDDWVTVTNAIDTSAIASGDFIHDNAIEISCATLGTAGHSEIYGLQLKESTSVGNTPQKKDLRIWIFNNIPASTISKNAARSWVANDVINIAGYIDVVTADYLDMQPSAPLQAMVFKYLKNGSSAGSQPVSVNTLATSSTIYIVIEARAAVTYATNDQIRVRLHIKKE